MAELEEIQKGAQNGAATDGLKDQPVIITKETIGTEVDAAAVDRPRNDEGPKVEDVPLAMTPPNNLHLPQPEQSLIDELKEITKFWIDWAHICIRIHWSVGLIGATSATLAASSQFVPEATATFAVISAVSFSIVGFVNPQKRASKFLASYRMLDPAIREYKYQERSKKSLLEEHVKAENILGDGEFDGK